MSPNHNSHLIVVNVTGTTGHSCGCPSWIEHWRRHTKGKRRTCARLGCQERAEVGAHVEFIDRRRTRQVHIAPLCRRCNIWHNGDHMPIDQRTTIIVADSLPGCG